MNVRLRLYPELQVGGFSHEDTTHEFFGRVSALVRPGDTMVDFGAGRGGFMDDPEQYIHRLRDFRGRAGRVIGVDIDPVVHENRSLDESLVWTPGQPIDLPDASVDLIVSDFTFEHVDDPTTVVAELQRILKPGGWLCARTPNKWGYIAVGARMVPNRLHVRFLRRLQGDARQARDVFPTRYRMNTLPTVRRLFSSPGWSVVGYTVNGEPAYFGRSRVMYVAWYGISRVLPRPVRALWLFFIRREPGDG